METIKEIVKPRIYLVLTSVFILLAVVYRPTFVWLWERYIASDSYYSHGFLIPFVSFALIWLKRNELGAVTYKYTKRGLFLTVLALLIHFFSILAEVFFVSGFSILVLVFGISLFLFGKKLTGKISFPLFFLFFMMPLPLVAVNAISFPLKMLVTKAAIFVLGNLFNIPVRNEGFQIFLPRASLVVENPCSGLRSLIVMIALGSIFTYFLKNSVYKRVLFFILSIPVALLSNITRVLFLSLSVYIYGSRVTEKYVHDFSGYLMFIIAFGGLWLLWRLFQCKDSR